MVLVARFVIVLSRTLTIKQVNGSIRWLVASYWRLVCLWVTADGGGENPQLIVLPQRQTKDDFLGLRCRGDAVLVRVCVCCVCMCVCSRATTVETTRSSERAGWARTRVEKTETRS